MTYNSHRGRDAYRHLLRLKWTPAENRESPTDGDFSSGAIAPGRINLRAQDRHALTVQNTFWNRGYGYAFTPDLPGASVFVHAAHCPDGFRPQPGERFTAHLVQTNRGLQARDVRPE